MVFYLKIKGKVTKVHQVLGNNYKTIGASVVLDDGSELEIKVGDKISLEVQKNG